MVSALDAQDSIIVRKRHSIALLSGVNISNFYGDTFWKENASNYRSSLTVYNYSYKLKRRCALDAQICKQTDGALFYDFFSNPYPPYGLTLLKRNLQLKKIYLQSTFQKSLGHNEYFHFGFGGYTSYIYSEEYLFRYTKEPKEIIHDKYIQVSKRIDCGIVTNFGVAFKLYKVLKLRLDFYQQIGLISNQLNFDYYNPDITSKAINRKLLVGLEFDIL